MRVLVTGASGQLGSDLMLLLGQRSDDVALGLDLPEIDITDAESVHSAFADFAPEVVVNSCRPTTSSMAEP